jgi:lysozyme family protein
MFEQALDLVLGFEGGYSNNPADPGGATNLGITQNTYDDYRRHAGLSQQSVHSISHTEVLAIYRSNYWNDGQCDKIDLIDPFIALVHFDGCVNSGIGQQGRILQRTLGVTADGIVGPESLAELKFVISKDKHNFRVRYLAARLDFYLDLVLARSVLRVFLPSWCRRIQKLMEKLPNYD